MSDTAKNSDSKDKEKDDHPPTMVVWTVRVLSVAALLALLIYLINGALSPTVLPQFTVNLDHDGVEKRGQSWVLPGKVTNNSTRSVTALIVEVTIDDEEGEPVSRQVEIPLIGQGEHVAFELRYPTEPIASDTSSDILSYLSP